MRGLSDALVITKRQLQQLIRVPEVLIFNTIQPVMFVLLFRYVFGGLGAGIPGGYVQLLMPGIFVQKGCITPNREHLKRHNSTHYWAGNYFWDCSSPTHGRAVSGTSEGQELNLQ